MTEPMPCCSDQAESLSLLAADCLDREEALPVERHIAACTACRAHYAELVDLCGALAGLRASAPMPLRPMKLPPLDLASELPSPVVRFDFRGALWPLAIAASVLLALWPSAPAPPPVEPEPPTWFAYQRAAARGDAALDALLREHADVFRRPLSNDTETLLTALTLQP